MLASPSVAAGASAQTSQTLLADARSPIVVTRMAGLRNKFGFKSR